MKKLTFKSKLFRLAKGMEYYALEVPEQVTSRLKTKIAVPVYAEVNGSEPFLGSLYPTGKGRHGLRVKNKICKAVGIKAGDAVKVKIEVRDRLKEIALPKDLKAALKEEGVLKEFESFPPGKKSFILRKIEEAAQMKTRKKRIQLAVQEAHKKRESTADKGKK